MPSLEIQMQREDHFIGRNPVCRVAGAGPPVVVINGGQGFVVRRTPARAARDARRVARLLPPGRGFWLVGYDPAPPAGLTLEAIADRIAAGLGGFARPPVVLGISFGGVVAAHLAARHPQLVGGLGFIASAHRFSAAGAARIGAQIDALERGDAVAFLKGFAAVFRNPLTNLMLAGMLKLRRRRMIAGLNDTATIVRYLKLVTAGTGVDLAAIAAPALILGGGRDQFFGDGAMPETARGISGAELSLLDRETHMAPVEAAGEMRARLAAWLGRVAA